MEPDDGDVWDGKRGACAGVLQAVAAEIEPRESLREVLALLRTVPPRRREQAAMLERAVQRWAQANGM